ncbi:MAG: riboflavin synthase [Planctomycetes bacterium]|nr:riboflavin synthase [Planctomycetota bacterium]
MFTGLVETLGTVHSQSSDARGGASLVIAQSLIAPQLVLGESVAVNGACLTVVAISDGRFSFDVGPETLLKTNLGQLRVGDRVNLERSLRVGDRLGGHFVQGHVDAVGSIEERAREGEWEMVRFRCPGELTRLMVPKGSIAVDGISLTLVEVGPDFFTVMLIPHTSKETTLGVKKAGDSVNLEADMLAKHVQKLLQR